MNSFCELPTLEFLLVDYQYAQLVTSEFQQHRIQKT
jgi:hypothetical protein